MAYKVFIISAYKDADLAMELTRRLEKVRVKVLSKMAQPSESIDHRIRRSLGESDEVLFLLTDNSLHSERVTLILGAAFGLHKPITAILVGVSEEELPLMVRGMRHIKYVEVDEYIFELQNRSEKQVV